MAQVHVLGFVRPRPLFSQRVKLALACLLTIALAWVLFIAVQYLQTRKPISQLPGLPLVGVATQPPSYQLGFYGGSAQAALVAPLGVATAPSGDRVYVTESGGERATLVFDRGGNLVGKLVPPDAGPGGRYPLYAAVNADGAVYVSDRLRGVIDVYTPSGEYQATFAPKESPPVAPMGLAFDRAGNLYVTDLPDGQHRLLVYDPDGHLTLSIGSQGSDPGQFAFPNGVAVDARGTIYVTDSNNGRVEVFDPGGKLINIIGRGGTGILGVPRGVAVDELGRLFIVDTTGQTIEVWDVTSTPARLYTIGSEGTGAGQFNYPNGIALDPTGRVYVTDRLNNRLQVWSF